MKSLILLLCLNLILLSPIVFFKIHLLILMIGGLAILNIYLIFFHYKTVLKSVSLQHFTPDDPWKVTSLMQELTANSSLSIQCYKTKADSYASFCFGRHNNYYIVLPDLLLDFLSEKQLRLVLSYYVHAISKGCIFYLTLWSGIIFLLDSFLSVLLYPIRRNKKGGKIGGFLDSFLKLFLSFGFYKLDHAFPDKKDLSMLLFHLNSCYRLKENAITKDKNLLVVLGDCLQKNNEHSYYPSARKRIQKLQNAYPPEYLQLQ